MTPDGNSGFEVCENLANGMQIDLEEKQYYLSVLSFTVAEGEILSLQIGNQSRRVSVVGERFYIDPQEFSGNLDIECKKDTGPPKPSYPDDVDMEVTSSDGTKMNIFLNTVRIGEEAASIIATGKGYASGNINNLIKIQLEFGSGNIGIITVNGVEINIPEGTTDEFEFSVAPVATYKIVVKKSKDTSNTPRTIVWASDKNDNFSLGEDELLKNGTVEILSIKDPDGNPVDMGDVTQDTEKNTGRAVIIPGSKVTFRLKPDYGYQLTSIRINDEKLIAGEEQSTFEYTMPDTNIHFSGIFEKVEDKVKIESNKVKDGTIEIGDQEIDSGSVVLSVNDANISKEQISDFKEKADGYKISSYLNISLDQVLYKGTADDVWSNQLKELNDEATVSLNLEEDMDSDEVVVIHEKDDGTYEVIPTTYDASSNRVTFKTSSFSNYAIASKVDSQIVDSDIDEDSESLPQTGDNILKYALFIVLAVMILVAVLLFRRQKLSQK